ncbi:MAG: hypothetical protein IPK39_23390 [Sulfuritalea sp.]|nr:hypothetical protein [Sulfuritalea sp.]
MMSPHGSTARSPDAVVAFDGRGADFSLAGQGRLAPFASQPLVALRLTARGLDPRAFAPTAPRARLALDADLAPDTSGALAGQLRVDNAAAAPLDRDGLPLTHLAAHLLLDWNAAPRRIKLSNLALKVGAGGRRRVPSIPSGLRRRGAAIWHRRYHRAQARPRCVAQRALRPASMAASPLPRMASHSAPASLAEGARRMRPGSNGTARPECSACCWHRARRRFPATALSLAAPHAWRFAGGLRHVDPAAFVTRLPRGDLSADFLAEGKLRPQLAGTLRFRFEPSRLASETLGGAGDLAFSAIDRVDDLVAANGKAWLRGTLDLALGDSKLAVRGGWGGPEETLSLTLAAPDLARHRALLPNIAGALDLSVDLGGFRAGRSWRSRRAPGGLPCPGDLGRTAGRHGAAAKGDLVDVVRRRGPARRRDAPASRTFRRWHGRAIRIAATAGLPGERRLSLRRRRHPGRSPALARYRLARAHRRSAAGRRTAGGADRLRRTFGEPGSAVRAADGARSPISPARTGDGGNLVSAGALSSTPRSAAPSPHRA